MDEEAFAGEFDFLARTTEAARYRSLLQLVPPCADRALDAGCGTGILAMHLATRVRHVVAVDISRSMIAVAERHRARADQRNVSFVLADLETPPFAEQSFDFVVAAASVQRTHLRLTLPGLRRLVTPGGRLALYVNVSSFPRLRDWRPVRILMNIPQAMRHVNDHGFPTAWRLFRFQTSRAWLQQGDVVQRLRAGREGTRKRPLVSANSVPTPEALSQLCRQLLPGCRMTRTHGWAMTVVWDAPGRSG